MYEQAPSRPARSSIRPVLLAVLASFLLGASVVGFLAWRGYLGLSGTGASLRPAPAAPLPVRSQAPSVASPQVSAGAAAAERVAETQGGIDQRLAAAEQRIARLDLQAQAAAGNAGRAEGLLIAFAARRAIERGAELGYLSDQLRLRFGDAQPNAVDMVIEFARRPVTLDTLVARLDRIGAQLAADADQPVLARLRNELSSLFVIRKETTPSPQPGQRLERARMFLESGRVDEAIAEIERLPGAANAAAWLTDARRYARARKALDLIETAAVREPRLLRDGTGRPVEQPSPADSPIAGP